ncbi:MAG: D-alanine--D-alanine ligase [bacterium]|nr:D-alanine--D-alanine ligase [bacterium]
MANFKKVAVLMGGTSNEREVSLVSGKNVAEALVSLDKYDVVPVVLDADNLDALPADVDACYVTLHGGWGENGGVQSALDGRGIPYTGPGASASRVTMDKIATKKILDQAGVPNAPWCVVGDADADLAETDLPLPLPVVVKAPRDGSSVGVYLVKTFAQWADAVHEAVRIDREKFGGAGEALVEAFIPGREMTVGVLGHEALPVVEICAPGGWYGYEEKYNSNETSYPFPTDDFIPEMQRLALAAFDATGCRGVTRVDFRVTPEGRMFVLELNTSPGMTGHSLVPKAAGKIGISFPELCDRVLGTAVHD